MFAGVFFHIVFTQFSILTVRDEHDLVLEENRTELNQTVSKIHNRTELLKWFSFMVLNQIITNFSLKNQIIKLNRIKPNC
jgi:hypothetical protein